MSNFVEGIAEALAAKAVETYLSSSGQKSEEIIAEVLAAKAVETEVLCDEINYLLRLQRH